MFRRWFASRPPAVPVAPPVRLKAPISRIRRSMLAALYDAWQSVTSNVPLIVHQRHRLAQYVRLRPRGIQDIPEMDVSPSGHLVHLSAKMPLHANDLVLSDPSFGGHDPDPRQSVGAAETRFQRHQYEAEAEVAAQEMKEIDQRRQRNEQQRRETEAKLDGLRDQGPRTAEVVASKPANASATGNDEPAEPTSEDRDVPTRATIWGLYCTLAMLLISEFAHLSGPIWNANGLDYSAIGLEVRRNTMSVVFTSVSVFAVTVAFFYLTALIFKQIKTFTPSTEYIRKHWMKATGLAAASAGILTILWTVAAMRAHLSASVSAADAAMMGLTSRPSVPTFAFFGFAAGVLVCGGLIHLKLQELKRARATSITPTAAEVAETTYVNDVAATEAQLAAILEERDRINAHFRLMAEERHGRDQTRRDVAREEQADAAQYLDDVAAAMERDHYAFMRIALKRDRQDLLPPKETPHADLHLVAPPRTRAHSSTKLLPMLLFILGTPLVGCSPADSSVPRTAFVFTSPDPVRSHAPIVASEVEAWRKDAVRDPGAVCTVAVAGENRMEIGPAYVASVPAVWVGGDVMRSKAAWATGERARFRAAAASGFRARVPVAASPSLDANERVVVIPPVDSRGQRWRVEATTKLHEAVVCDASSSVESDCRPETLVMIFDRWLGDAPAPGSTFEVFRVGTSINTVRSIFRVQVPLLAASERLLFLFGARNELPALAGALTADGESGSAIAEAITVATAALREKDGRRRLTVASDLQQVTPGAHDFARLGVPENAAFVSWLRASALLPDCRGVTVSVCGFSPRAEQGTIALTPRAYASLRGSWSHAFEEMGAKEVTMFSSCDAVALGGQ